MSIYESNFHYNRSINILPNITNGANSSIVPQVTINPNAVDKTPNKDTVLIRGKTYKKRTYG